MMKDYFNVAKLIQNAYQWHKSAMTTKTAQTEVMRSPNYAVIIQNPNFKAP